MKKMVSVLLLFLISATAQGAIVNGSVSGTGADVGSTSKGLYAEMIDSSGKLQGPLKPVLSYMQPTLQQRRPKP
jgi:hypothetical protein